MAELFRKEAMEEVSSPEKLDKHIQIMRPSIWILYAALVVALVAFLLWSFTYPITDGIEMEGVIFTNDNVVSTNVSRSCMVTDVLVSEGEQVDVGDLIAVVSADDLLETINVLRTSLAAVSSDDVEYQTISRQLEQAVETYASSTVIRSGTSGRVQSVRAMGTSLSPGDPIVSIEPDTGYEEVVAYVPLQTAGSLSLGMVAQVSPSYAPREEYGYMTGVITSISDVPVTEERILAQMGTLSYVEGILPQDSCVEVRIRLDLDDDSANHYLWSNHKGESLSVALGTQCSIFVVTDEYLPVEMMLD